MTTEKCITALLLSLALSFAAATGALAAPSPTIQEIFFQNTGAAAEGPASDALRCLDDMDSCLPEETAGPLEGASGADYPYVGLNPFTPGTGTYDERAAESARPAFYYEPDYAFYNLGCAISCVDESSEDTDTLTDVPVVVNEDVESFISYFQTAGRPHFEKWLERTRSYMNRIQEILRDEGLPEDLFYIALIESGLNPRARSRSNAVGMWQFMKGTALKYGLRVDWWIDERRDPEKATHAAAHYLKSLYNRFDSWYLAAAGYNAGEGRVARAMKKHGSEDFWELASHKRTFRRETRNYVPKYLAAMLIAKNPAKYGFDDPDYHAELVYDKATIPQATDLRVIARAAGTTTEEIKRLNPALLHWFTPPDYKDFEIKLPVGTAETFTQNFSEIPAKERLRFLKHRIRRGDTLYMIARRYKTPMKQIIYLNDIKRPRYLRPGTLLVVPVRAKDHKKRGPGIAEAKDPHRPQG